MYQIVRRRFGLGLRFMHTCVITMVAVMGLARQMGLGRVTAWVLVVTFVCRAPLMVMTARLVPAWSLAAIVTVVMNSFLPGMVMSSRVLAANVMMLLITMPMIPDMMAALLPTKRRMTTVVLV